MYSEDQIFKRIRFRVMSLLTFLCSHKDMYKVLFVCTGNICRSPTAEGVFRKLADDAGKGEAFFADSAGISGWHAGSAPDARAVEAALYNGVDISALRARQVVRDDFKDFDLIVALDQSHLKALEGMRPGFSPAHERAALKLMMDFAPEYGITDVPDPYYGGKEGFQNVFNMIESACRNLLNSISPE